MQPGMPDLQHIVLKAQQMQAEMERAQATLSEAEVTGSAGGGLVTAVATAAVSCAASGSTRPWSIRRMSRRWRT